MPDLLRRTYLLWIALAAIVAGYLLLGAGDVVAAPLLLVAGYCVLVPLFLWRSFRDGSGEPCDRARPYRGRLASLSAGTGERCRAGSA